MTHSPAPTPPPPAALPDAEPGPIAHYENFPVASWLCPPQLRAPIAAIYHFARTADDLADEGPAPAAQRLQDLHAYRQDLHDCARQRPYSPRWGAVFAPLQAAMTQHALPVALLDDLLSAFIQDVAHTRDAAGYADRAALLDYCRRSANPVGRLLLHLYQVQEPEALAHSDAICTALQLINFWQDLSVDLPRGRFYLTDADCQRFGISRQALLHGQAERSVSPALRALILDSNQWAQDCMHQGLPLVHRLPGRIGWELRLMVQGGLRIAHKVQAQQGASLHTRLTLGKRDLPAMLWRALWM